jgi:nucleotide-binding universal stress UspA family protein
MITTSDFTRPEQDRRAGTRVPKTYRTILVAPDGSLLAERALPFARRLAAGTGARLVLVRAVTARTDRPDPGAEGEAEPSLKRIVRQERGHGRTPLAVLAGEPAPALLAYARSRAADLVVMATHGRGGLVRAALGSVAAETLHRATVPLMLIPVPAAVTPDRHAGDAGSEPGPASEPGRGSQISPVTLWRSAMTTTTTTTTATRGGAVVTSGRTQRVDFDEGEFDAACDACGVRPTAIVVRVWDEEFEALQKTGEAGLVEAHAFCAEHQGAADDLYHQLVRP